MIDKSPCVTISGIIPNGISIAPDMMLRGRCAHVLGNVIFSLQGSVPPLCFTTASPMPVARTSSHSVILIHIYDYLKIRPI